jgi:hypothetical protein
MTAINVCIVPGAVHLFTDAGHIDIGKNRVEGIANKVMIAPEYNAAIAASGFAFIEKIMASVLAQTSFVDFDALATGFPALIKQAIVHGTHYGAPSSWPNCEIVLAGWSRGKDEPVAIVFESADGFRGKEVTRFVRPAVGGLSFDCENVAESGLALMRAQRNTVFTITDDLAPRQGFTANSYHRRVVYGFCQETVVTRDAITTRVLERWDDKVAAAAA